MASASLSLLLVLLASLSLATAQDSAAIAQCVPQLLPLAPCGPFVQGSTQSPAAPCCDSLKQIYRQQPQCLCMLLNNTAALTSLPINSSLAFQLPVLCSLQVDISVCSSGSNGPTSPASQVSLGSTGANSSAATNSAVPASPVFQPLPTPPNNGTEHGLGNNGGKSTAFDFAVLVMVITSTLVVRI